MCAIIAGLRAHNQKFEKKEVKQHQHIKVLVLDIRRIFMSFAYQFRVHQPVYKMYTIYAYWWILFVIL